MSRRLCKACSRVIVFDVIPSSPRTPIDEEPWLVAVGELPIWVGWDRRTFDKVRGRPLGQAEKDGAVIRAYERGAEVAWVWRSHFQTCTDPGRFGRARNR